MGRARSWTDAQLREAVAASTTFKEVHARLGLKPGGGSHSAVRLRIAELGLDVSHFEPRRRTATPRRPPSGQASPPRGAYLDRIDPHALSRAVAASRSIRQTLGHLGIGVNGSTYAAIKAAIRRHGIDTSHLKGQGWARGTRGVTRNGGRPLDDVLVRDSPVSSTRDLRQRLLKAGLKEHRCEQCGRTEWEGQPIPLQLDHINGDRRDNRLENLRLVCPNCHAQTDTWCGRNVGRYPATG
jgi:hypothetical protein